MMAYMVIYLFRLKNLQSMTKRFCACDASTIVLHTIRGGRGDRLRFI